ncbi:MAG: hypothetical protein LBH26_07685 [Treponema sp.]|nr:hypothetical protein [Treponema sp.]
MKKTILCLFVFFAVLIPFLGAVDYTNGHLRLTLDEGSGRFFLYCLTGFSPLKFEPLFESQSPRTSLLTAYYNEKAYKLGENSSFKIRLDNKELSPALIFESSFLRVTERFEFIKTGGSSSANGVKITFTVENTGSRRADAGIRLLLDTNLGEGRGGPPLVTDLGPVNGETSFEPVSPDRWWRSGNDSLSLIGSLGPEAGGKPDLVHVANWKRLNDASWKLRYSPGRNFTNSSNIGDSAVAYYFEPRRILTGESFSVSLLLAANDPSGFAIYHVMTSTEPPMLDSPYAAADPFAAADPPAAPSSLSALEADMNALRDLLARIDRSINAGFLISDEELLQMEQEIARLRSRYGSPEPR